MTREFTVFGKIRGQGRPKAFSRGRFTSVYKDKNDRLYESQIASAYINDCGNPEPFGEVPLVVQVECFIEVPESYSKKKREQALNGETYPTKKPDIDNICKSIFDALTGKAYPDDKFIVKTKLSKVWAEQEKMVVSIKELETETGELF